MKITTKIVQGGDKETAMEDFKAGRTITKKEAIEQLRTLEKIPIEITTKIGPYKGFYGQAEFDPITGTHYGEVIDIKDVITFVGYGAEELRKEFKTSVDCYLEFCELQKQKEKD